MTNVKVKVRDNSGKIEGKTTDIDVIIRKKRFGRRSAADLKRKRPRNPDEKRILKKWEKERGGKEIGNI